MKIKDKNKNELIKAAQREKKRNYIILYTVTLLVWLVLVSISFVKGFFTGEEFIVNIVNNIIGILPPILIFDFFNEKLSRDASPLFPFLNFFILGDVPGVAAQGLSLVAVSGGLLSSCSVRASLAVEHGLQVPGLQ